jgi:hypothetical protein
MLQNDLVRIASAGFFFFLLQVPQPTKPDGVVTVLSIPSKKYGSIRACENDAQKWNGVVIPSGTITTLPCTQATYDAPAPVTDQTGSAPD